MDEAFFTALYFLAFMATSEDLKVPGVSAAIMGDPDSAGAFERARANKLNATWPLRLAYISFLGMAFKQIINALQLVKASI